MSQPSEPRVPRYCACCGQLLPECRWGRPRKIVDLERARALLETGMSLNACARTMGMSTWTLRKAIRAAGMLYRVSERHRAIRMARVVGKGDSHGGQGPKNPSPAS